jgi:hypothetical protein
LKVIEAMLNAPHPENVKSVKNKCAGSSGAVHSVFLIDVYLDLENPGGRDFG